MMLKLWPMMGRYEIKHSDPADCTDITNYEQRRRCTASLSNARQRIIGDDQCKSHNEKPGRLSCCSGQHAVYFGAALRHLTWQTSDRPENHTGLAERAGPAERAGADYPRCSRGLAGGACPSTGIRVREGVAMKNLGMVLVWQEGADDGHAVAGRSATVRYWGAQEPDAGSLGRPSRGSHEPEAFPLRRCVQSLVQTHKIKRGRFPF